MKIFVTKCGCCADPHILQIRLSVENMADADVLLGAIRALRATLSGIGIKFTEIDLPLEFPEEQPTQQSEMVH